MRKNSRAETRDILFKMVEKTYREGIVPKDFTQSRTISKKGNPTECNNYRTISLLTHASKILLNIIRNRIWKKTEINLREDQFGFRQGMGAREAILALRTIAERRLNMNRNTYMGFIDLEKAFDTVNWNLLMTTLKRTGLEWRNRKIIMKLYKHQETIIKKRRLRIHS